jgi:hypothetical protein
MPRGRLDV